MLKRLIIIILVTVVSSALAVGDFFLMRELSRPLAIIIHNILASLVGVGFVIAAEMVRRQQIGKINYYSIFLLAIGLGMLAIHLIKIFFTRC